MTKTQNHGGGKFAQTKGENRKAEKRYDKRAVDYAKMVAGWTGSSIPPEGAFHKPGSRKKVY